MNNPEKETRIVKIVPTDEIKEWKTIFALHGTKAHLERKTNISRKTLNDILENKKGVERLIKLIRKFVKQQSITA
jgi:hypothetical protein